jgi:arsenate reductase
MLRAQSLGDGAWVGKKSCGTQGTSSSLPIPCRPFYHLSVVASEVDVETVRDKLKILFLCTGNSCRSQMAEGWARHLKSEKIHAFSAGVEKHGLDPRAVQVMAEAAVDISSQHSKTIDELRDLDFDYVITVCDEARESCPLFLGRGKVIHSAFEDPPTLAKEDVCEEDKLAHYRRVRDEIRAFVEALPDSLPDLE